MAIGDSAVITTSVANAMAKIYELRPDKQQFVRSQETSRHFKARKQMMKGEEYHWKVFTQPMSAARAVGDAVTAERSEFPAARSMDHVDVYATWANLMEFRTTIEYTGLVEQKTKDLSAAVYHAAQRLVSQVDGDFGTQINAAMHQDSARTMAVVATVANTSGTVTATPGANALLTISTAGSVTQFNVGQRLYIWPTGTHTATAERMTVYVRDVIEPGEVIGNSTGPGIIVTWEADGSAAPGSTNCNNIVATDDITLSGENAGCNFYGFPSWFSATVGVFSITRTDVGSRWSIPMMAGHSGTAQTLDVENDFGTMALNLSYAVKTGRNMRKAEGIELSGAFTAIGCPETIDEFTRQMGDRIRYTSDLTAAQKKELFGVSGFDGGWFHHPLLQQIALQTDPVATPRKIRFMDPNSWFWICGHEGGSPDAIEWLDKDGKRFHYEHGTTGRMTNILVGGALLRINLGNDQPKCNYQLSDVKSSLKS